MTVWTLTSGPGTCKRLRARTAVASVTNGPAHALTYHRPVSLGVADASTPRRRCRRVDGGCGHAGPERDRAGGGHPRQRGRHAGRTEQPAVRQGARTHEV